MELTTYKLFYCEYLLNETTYTHKLNQYLGETIAKQTLPNTCKRELPAFYHVAKKKKKIITQIRRLSRIYLMPFIKFMHIILADTFDF